MEKATKITCIPEMMKGLLHFWGWLDWWQQFCLLKFKYNLLCTFSHNWLTQFFPCLVICKHLYYWRIWKDILFKILLGIFYSNELCKTALWGIPKLCSFSSNWSMSCYFIYEIITFIFPQNTHINSKFCTFVLQKGISILRGEVWCSFKWYLHFKHTECTSSFLQRGPVFQNNLKSYL